MSRFNNCGKIWNSVYQRRDVTNLPWYGIPFFSNVAFFLKGANVTDLIILPGCGVGDTVEELCFHGYANVIGTDISSVAIALARERFPIRTFYCVPTELLSQQIKSRAAHVIDWLNLHQIPPEQLKEYLASLKTVSSSLLMVYFYDSQRPLSQKSMITGELIYNHDPLLVNQLLDGFKKCGEFTFYTEVNNRFGKLNRRWRTVALTYREP